MFNRLRHCLPVCAIGLAAVACSSKNSGMDRHVKNAGAITDPTAAETPPAPKAAVNVLPAKSAEFGVSRTAIMRPKMGDRFYVSSVFLSIFGPEAATIVTANIRNNMPSFGAPCDQLGRPDGNFCAGRTSLSQLSMVPTSVATREGYRLRTCESLVYKDDFLKHAIGQAQGAVTTATPTASSVDTVYELFFPGQQPTSDARTALLDVAHAGAEGGTALDGWRFLFLTICSSPDWQLL